jgi:hypothetical protein
LFIKKSNANKRKEVGCSSTSDGVGIIKETNNASNNDDADKTKETGCSCNNIGVNKGEGTGCTSKDDYVEKSKQADCSTTCLKYSYDINKVFQLI